MNNVGFLGLLALLFIGLKLGNIITWSWWYVLMPLWVPLAIVALYLVVGLVLILCGAWRPKVNKAFKSKFQTRLEEKLKEKNR